MDALAKAWSKAVRTAFPGPWRPGLVVREVGGALLLGALAMPLEAGSDSGLFLLSGPATAVLFLLRRGLPATVLVLTAAASGWAAGPLPLLVCAGWSAGARVKRVGVLAGSFTGGFLLMTAVGVVKDIGAAPVKLMIGFSLGGFLLLAVLPALWGRYRAQRRALLDALRERNDQLLRERVMVAHQARLRERHRIAQDMHDSLGHQLALISVHTGALEVDRTLTDRQREAVGVLRLAAVAAMRELREVVGVLHDESTAPLPAPAAAATPGTGRTGGLDDITRLVESSRAAGTPVSFSEAGDRRPPAANVGHAAYRIVQEALTNAHKHAPGAVITVALRYEPDALVVEVVNPRAPEPVGVHAAGLATAVSGGQGLTGLRERARLVGGMVHAGPTPEAGFRLAAVLPYEGAGGAPADGAGDTAAGAVGGDGAMAGVAGAEAWLLDTLPAADGRPGARRWRSPALGCALGGLLVLLVVGGLLAWGVVSFVRAADEATVKRSVYDSLQVGTPQAEVEKRLPAGNAFFTKNYEGSGPTPPAGAACRYFLSGETTDTWGEDNIVRLCFKDGALVEKEHYPVKS
ncbi:sensor histidine kinase [Kitasatospora sp. RG8]|uniref:sensor histidine kinase n=1 Tax=Kitasatospora sp. RG8 TaxID=2820815 RepID=UPI001ADFCB4A|nr:histidine kinase [Kitasatospora sp. RG8]MBP0451529.1 sensor histidine kinase [Kitasatospora sp. RG8]